MKEFKNSCHSLNRTGSLITLLGRDGDASAGRKAGSTGVDADLGGSITCGWGSSGMSEGA
jgi:hypothetical protein